MMYVSKWLIVTVEAISIDNEIMHPKLEYTCSKTTMNNLRNVYKHLYLAILL